MPLLQKDNNRRPGGGSRDNRRSFTKFLGLDTSSPTELVAAPKSSSGHANEEWSWNMPSSPEAAHTPGSLVPSNCFPPRHPTAFTSYSELARPGSWVESGQGIADLVASLSLTMPSSSSDYTPGSSCDSRPRTTVPTQWSQNLENTKSKDRKKELMSRRASFCGAVSSESKLLVWSGRLPSRSLDGDGFSTKVFLGGLPWDVSEYGLMQALNSFQPIRVEWPGRGNSSLPGSGGDEGPRGFAYVTFENEKNVRALLAAARRNGNKWYYQISARNMKIKEVEVIPWSVADSICVVGGSIRLDPTRTVFVGALHGMLSAEGLATIMNDLFSGVVYAGIDTDKHKYPIGSGRVTFNNLRSYICAVSAGFVEIRTDKFKKKIQVDPYIEDSMCSVCKMQQGPYFCRHPECFSYYCRSCWPTRHPIASPAHRALMRNFKTNQGQPVAVPGNLAFCQNGNGSANLALLANRRRSLCDQSVLSGAFGGADSTPSPPTSGFSASSDHATEENPDW